jgi:hypothetical protein
MVVTVFSYHGDIRRGFECVVKLSRINVGLRREARVKLEEHSIAKSRGSARVS